MRGAGSATLHSMAPPSETVPRVAVVIPCYREKRFVLDVLAGIGEEVWRVYVVDDGCPEGTGDLVETVCTDPRVRVIRHDVRRGVGGATLTGYRHALDEGAEVVVKIDGDGQMDPAMIPHIVAPIVSGAADYTKGNRFYRLEGLAAMPRGRLIGNALLSFLTKFSTGYWDVFDPTNGFTAIHASVARELPFSKIHHGYFFESDVLFRLNTLRAVVAEVPMEARYGDEDSELRAARVVAPFLLRHLGNLGKRIFYSYYLRGFSVASLELVFGLALVALGVAVGGYWWIVGPARGTIATSGTVMFAALPVIIGVQLLLAFLSYDMQSQPRVPLHTRLAPRRTPPSAGT
jgi:dolichol-phosphate mannosyltransferase